MMEGLVRTQLRRTLAVQVAFSQIEQTNIKHNNNHSTCVNYNNGN